MIILFFGLILAVTAADLITKYKIPGILNPGIAWGVGAEIPWLWKVIVVLSFVLVVVLVVGYLRYKKRTWIGAVGLGIFVGGILGNAIDRIITGGPVHDFINFQIFQNNIADIALTVGAALIVLGLVVENVRGETR